MSISNNYIPEKINDFNTYLDGNKMIGVAASVTLPEVKMKTSTVSGAGINGEIDSPTIGQFESMEQEIDFNVLYSSAMDMLSPLSVVNLTLRAAQQVYDKTGGYAFKMRNGNDAPVHGSGAVLDVADQGGSIPVAHRHHGDIALRESAGVMQTGSLQLVIAHADFFILKTLIQLVEVLEVGIFTVSQRVHAVADRPVRHAGEPGGVMLSLIHI